MYVVAEIGCLECGNPTVLYGPFADEADARGTHPGAEERVIDFGDRMEDRYPGEAWHGDTLTVIYRLTDAGEAPQNRSE